MENKMGLFDLFKKKTDEVQDRSLKTEIFHVVGVQYCEENIKKLACCNPDWKLTAKQIKEKGKVNQRIFRYYFINKPVKLEPEPSNKHDKNAILVIVAGEKVGYVSRSDNVHVKEIMKKREIKYITCFIGGGKYITINDDGDILRDEESITIKVKIAYV